MSSRDPFDLIAEQPRKPPPPRPPPPASSQPSSRLKNVGIFGRRKTQKPPATAIVRPLPPSQNVPTGTLIDLTSPSNPMHHYRDAEKAIFTSGSTSNLSVYSSQEESGFEDDFGSVLSSGSVSPWASQLSPASFELDEPFTPPEEHHKIPSKLKSYLAKPPPSARPYCNPTIICVQPSSKAKPARPPPPKFLDVPGSGDSSPPMPSVPPPPPPADIINILRESPRVPPRPSQTSAADGSTWEATYDYQSDHPEDLNIKSGDVIRNVVLVNADWMKGEVDGRTGLFPSSYAHSTRGGLLPTKVICTFPFTAETWDDLCLKEGDIVAVTRRLDDNWLVGTCDTRTGQFPSNFVQDISELEHIK